jgi:peptide deformylase
MMTLTPLKELDPRLRQVCALLTKSQLRNREQQLEIDALLSFVYGVSHKKSPTSVNDKALPNTVGISASQLGIMKQICVVDLSIGKRGYTDIYVLINPQIHWSSKTTAERPEGCVNFQTTWGITRRSSSVKVSALDRSGNELDLKLSGWPATLIQHEIDHVNGRLFIDRLPDPTKAHFVEPNEYKKYHSTKPTLWDKFVDVTPQAITLPPLYQS